MKIRLIRHATLLLEMAGRRLLVDPMLSEAGAMDPIPGSPNPRRNPLVELAVEAAELVRDLDGVIVTHLHRDHFDPAAAERLPKQLPLLCQPGDTKRLTDLGFTRVMPVDEAVVFETIEVARTGGKHGVGLVGLAMGAVSGFVLRAPGEPGLYLAGDTVWCGAVREALETFRPDVVVVNAGGARLLAGSPITMTARDVRQVTATAPEARVVAVHMEALNHCCETRAELREAVPGLIIPADGDWLAF